MIEVRRDDGELCGFVLEVEEAWHALTVFGVVFDAVHSEELARERVLVDGLRVLADRWDLIDGITGDEEVVLIQQCSPEEVTVALGYYSIPGTPSLTIPVSDLTAGRWHLRLRSST